MSETFVKEPTEAELKEWLKPIEDPEILMSLVDLGLIYTCDYKEGKVDIKMSLTSPGCPAADYMVSEVKKRVLEYPGVTDATVAIVWEPKWDPKVMASEQAKEKLGIW